MYIIELIFKIKNNFIKKRKKSLKPQEELNEKCSHTFFPIDSTKKILACSKCGEIYKLKDKKSNPFGDKG